MQSACRRHFLKTVAGSGLAVAGLGTLSPEPLRAIEPLKRPGSPRLRLSLAAYSFRQYLPGGGEKPRAGSHAPIDLFQFIDYCVEHGCAGTELTSYYFPPDTDREFLLRVKRHAFLRGIAISGTAVGNTFTVPVGEKRDQQIALVRKWIDYAEILGAPHIRIFAGDVSAGVSRGQAQALSISAIEECCAYAGSKGIFLGLENHGGIVADPAGVLAIVREIKSPWFGVNLDTGNFHTDDPYADLARIAPYAVNVQWKAEVQRRGQKQEPADFARLARILRDANYQGYVALEYESEPDPWEAVPGILKRMQDAFSG